MDINAEFKKYLSRYTILNTEAVLHKMVEDGVITENDVNNFKSGNPSIFDVDLKINLQSSFDIKDIMGANFGNQTDSAPQPQFNRQIERTYQSNIQGDCWLLSDVNALSYTSWGSQLLHDCIEPDENGDVIVKFKGSPLPQKNFRITPKEIDEAKTKGTYSSGDDDMIALELATEKLLVGFVEAKLGDRVDGLDDIYEFMKSSYLVGATFKDDPFKHIRISDLLTGIETSVISMNMWNEITNEPFNMQNVLKYLTEHEESNAVVCTFDHFKDIFGDREPDDPVHGNHAYAVKNIALGKSVTVVDPYNSGREIVLPWKKFVNDVETIFVSSDSEKEKNGVLKSRPKDYEASEKIMKDYCISEQARAKAEIYDYEQRIADAKKQIELKNNIKKVKGSCGWMLLSDNDLQYNSITFKLDVADNLNKDNIVELLSEMPDMVLRFSKSTSSVNIGNRNRKKNLIEPVISALAEKATEVGVPKELISEFKNKCLKELNAFFYTDEKVIQAEVESMLGIIGKNSS